MDEGMNGRIIIIIGQGMNLLGQSRNGRHINLSYFLVEEAEHALRAIVS